MEAQEVSNFLYQEHMDLAKKIKAIEDSCNAYGFEVPSYINSSQSVELISKLTKMTKPYPEKGTWKEKVLYALEESNGIKMTIAELSIIVERYENADKDKIFNSLTQTCSQMAINGEIGVDKGYRNKYFLKSVIVK